MTDLTSPTTLRATGELEAAYDFWSRRHPSHFCVAVELAGPSTAADVAEAVRALADRHVLLSADVVLDGDEVALGQFVRHGQVPAVRILDAPAPLEKLIGQELATPFPPDRPTSRFRAVVAPTGTTAGTGRWTVVLVLDHQVADGMSALRLVTDLAAILDGRALPEPADPVSRESVLADRATPPPSDGSDVDSDLPPASVREFDGTAPQVRLESLSRAETSALARRARDADSTVGGAIVAACVQALADRDFVRVNVPIDLRPRTGSDVEVGLLMGNANVVYEQPYDDDLWTLARRVTVDVRAGAAVPALVAASDAVAGAMHAGLEEPALESALVAGLGFELLVSNLGVLTAPADGKDGSEQATRIEAVWGPAVLVQMQGERMLGVTTSGGCLRVVHVSHDDWPDVLGRIRDAL